MPAAPTNLDVTQVSEGIPHAELTFDHDKVDTAYYEIQKRADGSADNFDTFAIVALGSPELVESPALSFTLDIPSEPNIEYKVIAVAADGDVST